MFDPDLWRCLSAPEVFQITTMIRTALSLFLLSGIFPALAGTVTGRLFRDSNGNGRFDRGERILSGIGISDGDTIVWSDRKGRYRLEARPGTMLFPILPDGYATAPTGIQNTVRRFVSATSEESEEIDFALYPTIWSRLFRIAAIGDIQIDNDGQLEFARRTVLSEIASREDIDLVIHLGDLINDKPYLLKSAAAAIGTLPQPVWNVVGNHDLDTDIKPRRGTTFRTEVGTDIAALFRGKCCIVLLNNVETATEGLPDSQLRFLRQIIGRCPKEMLIVLCQHVPMAGVKNRETIFNLLEGHRTLILSAHAHMVFRQEWSDEISEISVGASCGSWWTGERDPWGIPVAIQQCGTPRGYFLLDFDKADYTFRFKGVGMDEKIGYDLWIGGENASDTEVEQLSREPCGQMILNIYGGGETTTAEYSTDGKIWRPMERVRKLAPAVARSIYMNKRGGYPTRFSRRLPLRRGGMSPHLWEALLPDSLLRNDRLLYFRISDTKGLAPLRFKRVVNLHSDTTSIHLNNH